MRKRKHSHIDYPRVASEVSDADPMLLPLGVVIAGVIGLYIITCSPKDSPSRSLPSASASEVVVCENEASQFSRHIRRAEAGGGGCPQRGAQKLKNPLLKDRLPSRNTIYTVGPRAGAQLASVQFSLPAPVA